MLLNSNNAIIFGSSGQDGYYLRNSLVRKNINVSSVSPSSDDVVGSISDYDFVSRLLSELKPDLIFHLAAKSSVSDEYNIENFNSIEAGTFNVLECSRTLNLSSRIFIAGSAFQFRSTNNPIDEKTELNSENFYALARNNSLAMARFYRNRYHLPVYFGYLFNHDSPLRSDEFFCKKIMNLAKNSTKRKNQSKVDLGDLSHKREFSYASDIVNAILALISQDQVHEAVIGSGVAYSLLDWVDGCFKKYDLDFNNFVKYQFNQSGKILVSSPNLIKSLGWSPRYSMSDLIEMM